MGYISLSRIPQNQQTKSQRAAAERRARLMEAASTEDWRDAVPCLGKTQKVAGGRDTETIIWCYFGYADQIPTETRFKASDFFVNRGDTHWPDLDDFNALSVRI